MSYLTQNSLLFLVITDSAHSFGATVACLVAGILMSTLGRRGATLYCTIPCYLVGYVVIGCASSYITIIVGRFLTGIGLGMTLTIPNVYIVEVTDPQFRGVLGVLPNLFCQLGIFFTYVVGQWLDWSHLAFACEFFFSNKKMYLNWLHRQKLFQNHNSFKKLTRSFL